MVENNEILKTQRREEIKTVWLAVLKTSLRSGKGYMVALEAAEKCTQVFKREFY
jgi:hypothetical protein